MSPCQIRNTGRTAGPSPLPKSRQSGVAVTRINSPPGPERTFFHCPEMGLSASLQVERATCVNVKLCGIQFHPKPSLGVLTPQGLSARIDSNPRMGRRADGPALVRRAHEHVLASQTGGADSWAGFQESVWARAEISGLKSQLRSVRITWASYLIFLDLCFILCKMGLIVVVVWGGHDEN